MLNKCTTRRFIALNSVIHRLNSKNAKMGFYLDVSFQYFVFRICNVKCCFLTLSFFKNTQKSIQCFALYVKSEYTKIWRKGMDNKNSYKEKTDSG
jgi:hypothetical protein